MREMRLSTSPTGTPTDAIFPLNLKAAPKHAEALGHLVAAFAALESTLFHLFLPLTHADINAARILFYNLTAFRTKSEMTLSLAKMRYRHNKDVTELEDLLKRINKSATKRNHYIHDLWCTDRDLDACQFRWGNKAASVEASKIQVRDIEQLTNQLGLWADELDKFIQRPRPQA
jgi:hypothetical protein